MPSTEPSLQAKPLKEPVKRLDFIDSLRGLAAVYVLCFHTALVPKDKLILPDWVSPFIMNGGSGVTLFFLISAFTLCYTLNFQQKEDKYLLKFYIRRVFRIFPLYYSWFILLRLWQSGFSGIWTDKFNIVLYALFGYNFIPGKQSGFVWASWTLGVEVVFYLFFPLVFYFVRSIRSAIIFVVISLIVAWLHQMLVQHYISSGVLGPKDYNIYYSLFNQLPVFAMGMLCFYIYNDALIAKPISANAGTALLGVGALLFFSAGYGLLNVVPNFFHLYIKGIIYGCIFFGLLAIPVKLIVNKVTSFYGAISYSLYLNHPVIVYKLNGVYQKIYNLHLPTTLSLLLCIGLTLGLVTVVSYLTYRFIESPMISYGRKLIKSIKPAPTMSNVSGN